MQDVRIDEKVDVIISDWMGDMLLHKVLIVISMLFFKCSLLLSLNQTMKPKLSVWYLHFVLHYSRLDCFFGLHHIAV